ncbi:MAG: hypothetical protein IKI06_09790, partial [Prevotella sp.]|nr:hypothetical protein [Prevotella sp.]
DLTCIEDKIEAVRSSVIWRLDFIEDRHPNNTKDKELIELIKRDAHQYECDEIDNMIEFDIRKHFRTRSWFWLFHHKKHGITFSRYIRCVLRTIKYQLA